MSKKPLVSILMPIYNGEDYLADAVQSIINQTYTNWELIILDDGSTDKTKEIVASFNDKRILFYENGENLGIVKSRNKLFRLASGDYCAIFDCDDISLPRRIEMQVEYMERNLECGMCGAWTVIVDKNNKQLGKFLPPSQDEYIRVNLLFQCTFLQSSLMLRRQHFADLNCSEDFPVAQDFDMCERCSHSTKMYNIPKCLVRYRWFDNNISHRKRDLQIDRANAVVWRQLQNFDNYKPEYLEIVGSIGRLVEKDNYNQFLKLAKQHICELILQNKKQKLYDNVAFQAVAWYRYIFYAISKKQYKYAFLALFYCKNFKSWFQLLNLIAIKVFR